MKRLSLIFTVIVGLGFINPIPIHAKTQIVWTAQSSYPPGLSQIYEPAVRFAERIEKLTDGELVVKMNPGDAIVPSKKVFEAVSTGTIDMGMTWAGWSVGMFNASYLLSNAYPDALQMREMLGWIYAGDGMELWNEVYKGHGVKVLPPYAVQGSEILCWSNKPINSLEDFKGLKIRTVGIWGRVLERLGAKVVSLAGGEVYTAMERGVIDAVEFNTPLTDKELGLYEISKFVLLPGIHQPAVPLETLVNEKSWEKLPDHLKLKVEMALRDTSFESMNKTLKQDAEAMQFIRNQKDLKVSKLTPEMMKEIVKIANEELDVYAKKDPMFAKVLKSQRDFRKLVEPYSELVRLPYTYAQ
jgi:TRAP-type mannitol/chloroaromatic compound transport system substrate-binding protein